MQVLVIEDEKAIAAAIKAKLEQAGYIVDVRHDGLDGYCDAKTGVYDLIILDIMLPNMDGLEILKRLRQEKITSKIIMLTALATVQDKLAGLDGGANDYLAKPFHLDELLARVKVQLRNDTNDGRLVLGDATLDVEMATLNNGGKSIHLSAKELQLLELFFRHPGQVFNQEYIYNKVWGVNADVESNSLEAYISFVRKKLRALDMKVRIIALRGMGYKMVEEYE